MADVFCSDTILTDRLYAGGGPKKGAFVLSDWREELPPHYSFGWGGTDVDCLDAILTDSWALSSG
jgi:hypothetical protein